MRVPQGAQAELLGGHVIPQEREAVIARLEMDGADHLEAERGGTREIDVARKSAAVVGA